jgi:hypothetical protein
MNKKPNIILFKDICHPFEQAKNELFLVKQDLGNADEQRHLKSLFLYSYAIFESTLSQTYAKILYAFPDRLNIDVIDFKKYKNEIISNSLSHKLIEHLSIDFSQKMSYGSIKDSLKRFGEALHIPTSGLNELEEIKRIRNIVTHNSTIQATIKKEVLVKYIDIIIYVLEGIVESIYLEYKGYTTTKLIRDSWNFLFNSPLLTFNKHWELNEVEEISHYKFDTLKEIAGSLSSSERTFFIFFMSNYSSGLCNAVFTLNDISMHVSISNRDKIAYITELFDRYPLLLQQQTINTTSHD